MSRRNKEATSSGSNPGPTLISRIDLDKLRAIKVSLRRYNVPEIANPPTTQRNIQDPNDLNVHRSAEGLRPLFDRDDILVNQEEHERVVLTSHKSPSPRRRSKYSRSRSRSRSIRTSRSRSRSPGKVHVSSHGLIGGNKTKPRSRSPGRRRSPGFKEREARFRDENEIVAPVKKRPGEYIPPKKRDVSPTKCAGSSHSARTPVKSPEKTRTSSPGRYESRRHSRSPNRDYHSHERQRSRSPHRRDRFRSRSPYFERRRSRSPPYRRSRRYSRTPERERYHSSYDHKSSRYSPSRRPPSPHEAGVPPLAPQFQRDGIFIPNAALLASGVIPGMFPPRPMMGMHMNPRPMAPMQMYPSMYRLRPPMMYNQPYKPKAIAPAKSTTTRTGTGTTTTATVTSSATRSSNSVTSSCEVSGMNSSR